MLSLVGNLSHPSIAALHSNYGNDIGDEISSLITDLTEEAENINDIQFAIPLNVRLVFARSDDEGNMVTLARAEEGIEGLKKAIILEKPVDREKTHPFKESGAISEINKRLYEQYSEDLLESRLVARNKSAKKPEINSYCFRSVVNKLKWKNSNNRYHVVNKDPVVHYYSDFAIQEFIEKVMGIEKYLENARKWNSSKAKKKKR